MKLDIKKYKPCEIQEYIDSIKKAVNYFTRTLNYTEKNISLNRISASLKRLMANRSILTDEEFHLLVNACLYNYNLIVWDINNNIEKMGFKKTEKFKRYTTSLELGQLINKKLLELNKVEYDRAKRMYKNLVKNESHYDYVKREYRFKPLFIRVTKGITDVKKEVTDSVKILEENLKGKPTTKINTLILTICKIKLISHCE